MVLGRLYYKVAQLKLEQMRERAIKATIFTPDDTGIVSWTAVQTPYAQIGIYSMLIAEEDTVPGEEYESDPGSKGQVSDIEDKKEIP